MSAPTKNPARGVAYARGEAYSDLMTDTTATATITATFPDGTTATRRSTAAYTHASRIGGTVRFHTSVTAARRISGATIVGTDYNSAADAAAADARSAASCDHCGGPGRSSNRDGMVGIVGTPGRYCSARCGMAARDAARVAG